MKNFKTPEWYSKLCIKSNLSTPSLVKGAMVLDVWGVKIWNLIQKIFNKKLKIINAKLIVLPTILPYKYIKKEKDHFVGFDPELYKIASNNKNKESLVLRPTSEILFCHFVQKKIVSWRDLPLNYYQWGNIFRCELNTKPFLRNSEFWWHEGHSFFDDKANALKMMNKIEKIYFWFFHNYLNFSFLTGFKTNNEKFAGAEFSKTFELFLPDGQALQCATIHYLGNIFVKFFKLKYQNKLNNWSLPVHASWGLSTRIIGALALMHSDENGLILPSNISPYQLIIIPKNFYNLQNIEEQTLFQKVLKRIKFNLMPFRIKFELSNKNINKLFDKWIVRGVPVIVYFDINDIKNNIIHLFSRFNNKYIEIKINELNNEYLSIKFNEHNEYLMNNSSKNLESKIIQIYNLNELSHLIKTKYMAKAYFCLNSEYEEEIKSITTATIRCYKKIKTQKLCFHCDEKTQIMAYFAKSY